MLAMKRSVVVVRKMNLRNLLHTGDNECDVIHAVFGTKSRSPKLWVILPNKNV